MNTIAVKQNEKNTIEYLAAGRKLYSRAKCLQVLKSLLCTVLIAGLAFARIKWPEFEQISYAIVIASVVALIAEPLLDWRISVLKLQGARMQQCFDNDLFVFSWNESVCGKRPGEDMVYDCLKGKPVNKKLFDWYVGIDATLDKDLATLLCQNQNGSYDRHLRKKYIRLCALFALVLLAVVIVAALRKDATLFEILVYAVVPATPIISWFITVFTTFQSDKEDLDRLDEAISSELGRSENSQSIRDYILARIQNLLFMHRKAAYLIPDCFYNVLRKGSEARAAATVKRILARQPKQ